MNKKFLFITFLLFLSCQTNNNLKNWFHTNGIIPEIFSSIEIVEIDRESWLENIAIYCNDEKLNKITENIYSEKIKIAQFSSDLSINDIFRLKINGFYLEYYLYNIIDNYSQGSNVVLFFQCRDSQIYLINKGMSSIIIYEANKPLYDEYISIDTDKILSKIDMITLSFKHDKDIKRNILDYLKSNIKKDIFGHINEENLEIMKKNRAHLKIIIEGVKNEVLKNSSFWEKIIINLIIDYESNYTNFNINIVANFKDSGGWACEYSPMWTYQNIEESEYSRFLNKYGEIILKKIEGMF